MLGKILSNVPYAGSAYGLVKTCNKVYNPTSPVEAVTTGIKSVIIDCTPPACVATGGSPLMTAATTSVVRTIILED